MRLLRIDTSPRYTDSASRKLADYFQTEWLKHRHHDEVQIRDLYQEPIGHIQQETITAFYTPPENLDAKLRSATATSDKLIKEIQSADILIVSSPMYNFSVPSALKAYIDQIVRLNATFKVENGGLVGLLTGKKAFVFTASGAVFEGTPAAQMDFLNPYLKGVLGFLGMEVVVMSTQGTSMAPEVAEKTFAEAKSEIVKIVSQLPKGK